MKAAADAIVMAVALAATFVAASIGQPPDTYTATATVASGESRASARVTITINTYASSAERAALIDELRKSADAARRLLGTRPDAGHIELGGRRTPIKYAWKHAAGGGHLVTVATAVPILFLGSDVAEAKSVAGFDFAIAILQVSGSEGGIGELAPAAKIALDEKGSLRIEDYGSTIVWLKDLVLAR
jgi:hypothetical protein